MDKKIGRRERKKQYSREAILQAAVRAFSQQGVQETSIAHIMEVADLGVGTFYNYFSSKEDLLKCLLGELVEEICRFSVSLQEENKTAREILLATVSSTAKLLAENRFVLPLFLSAAEQSGRPAMGHPAGQAPAFKGIFSEILQRGQTLGEFRTDIPVGIMTEMFHSMFQAAAFSHLPMDFGQNIHYKLQLLLSGIQLNGQEQESKR